MLDFVFLASLLLLSAFFSGTETAFTSISEVDIESLRKKKPKKAKLIEKLFKNPDIFLSTVLIGNNIANLSASALTTTVAIRIAGDNYIGIATGILTLVVLIFSEIIPKRLAISHSLFIATHSARIITLFSVLFLPISKFISIVTSVFIPYRQKPDLDQEKILSALTLAKSTGVLEEYKTRMMSRIIRFNQVNLHSVMTHRKKIFSLPADMIVEEAVEIVRTVPFSRIPLYKKDTEDISLILHIKDLFLAYIDSKKNTRLSDIAGPAVFLPETTKLHVAFGKLSQAQTKMAIVLDEYGGVAGIITMEDILEEIVGDLYDENEKKEESDIIKTGNNSYRINGNTAIHDFQDFFEVEVSTDSSTVAGYLTEKSGSIPYENQEIETELGKFIIKKANKTSVELVEFIRKKRQA
ncbi:hemolysin family protein [Spirochaetia bacterium 38H-sp]|uniref:Hemolysin family protein n=1 Tax=Rarispira pelagica TaxID=3141764 RepID=A0ABU9U9G3_9SPIR